MTEECFTEIFSVIEGSVRIGGLSATFCGNRVELAYNVFSNGRGERTQEQLRFNASMIPTRWMISGTSLMGGKVAEELSTVESPAGGVRHQWRSQGDGGTCEADGYRLYLAADSSPLSSWVYARAAQFAGGVAWDLPSGVVKIEWLRQVRVDPCEDVGVATEELSAFAVTGTFLRPEYVLLDSGQRLIAVVGGRLDANRIMIRDSHVSVASAVSRAVRELSQEHLRQAAMRVAHRHAMVRFENVRVFDPHTLSVSPPSSVTISHGEVVAVEPWAESAPQAGEVLIDGAGGTLVAGLHDMHVHLDGWSSLLHLAAGVTTVRDMGNDNVALQGLMERLESGTSAGPAVVPAGFIEGASEFSMKLGPIPQTLDEALGTVRWYAQRGYHQIKIYSSMNPDWIKSLVVEAHRFGLPTVGHVPAYTTPDRMIEAGYAEITHINQLMLGWLIDVDEDTRTILRITTMARAAGLDLGSERVRQTIRLMQDHSTGLDSTVAILERLMLNRAGTVSAGDAVFIGHLPTNVQRSLKRTYVPYGSISELDAYAEAFPVVLSAIKMLHDSGIRLWPGSDDDIGFTLHRELELYVAAGLEPPEGKHSPG